MRKGWFTVFVTIALLLIPFYLIPEMPLFRPSILGRASNYGFIIYIALIFGSLWWVFSKLGEKDLSKKVVNTLGFRWSWRQILIGFVIGCCTGIVMWHIEGSFSSIPLPPLDFVSDMLFAAPLFEEILFRGYLINRSLHVNRTSRMKILAAIASIFIFSWVHASHPEQKVVGGIIFTAVYLWGWKNNMTAAIMAHLGTNAAILFIGYSSLGVLAVIGTITIIFVMTAILILIIWNAHHIAHTLIKLWQWFLRMRNPRTSKDVL